MKFVILDEVDYMTKNAQQALKYLLQDYRKDVRFCLICNYISRIDDSLQNEFLKLRFNQLPKLDILNFLDKINLIEKLHLTEQQLESIQMTYKSDIRSMINYMQSNQSEFSNIYVISSEIYEVITDIIDNKDVDELHKKVYEVSMLYNIDTKTIIKDYCSHIIRTKLDKMNSNLLKNIERIVHNVDTNLDNHINLLFYSLS